MADAWRWQRLAVGIATTITISTVIGFETHRHATASAPASIDVATPTRPSSDAVAAMVDFPVAITARSMRDDRIAWTASFDRVPIRGDVESTKTATGWVTRWRTSREPPPPFHAVLSDASAIAFARLLGSGLRVERVYRLVADHYQAALEVHDDAGDVVTVDAHTGAVD